MAAPEEDGGAAAEPFASARSPEGERVVVERLCDGALCHESKARSCCCIALPMARVIDPAASI
jgi:hypothetical protein